MADEAHVIINSLMMARILGLDRVHVISDCKDIIERIARREALENRSENDNLCVLPNEPYSDNPRNVLEGNH